MNTVADMRDAVFFDGEKMRTRFSRFWILLVLAAVIASAGVVGDSTATVIGAMIVAPLMTPIMGIALATVLGDRRNLLRSWLLVVTGALAAIAIGYVVGLFEVAPVTAATNPQVASRVAPDVIDLVAALATGAVGAISLVRSDISDTLPGVAIAISLVPPLCVVGLTLESGVWLQALGALLLFATNVAAIIATGVVILAARRVGPDVDAVDESTRARRRPRAIVFTLLTLVVIAIPLAVISVQLTQQAVLQSRIHAAADPWATQNRWDVADVSTSGSTAVVRLTGPMPIPDTVELVTALKAQGVDPSHVTLEFVPGYEVTLGH
ncbi:TIGR00341 family protein [Microbacterium candidum]|uniref:TIGR00341 family protein n=1 Tax=Microbacterium candidum TaxID=3041922 RepID=A0ABT7MTC0_9MICO|nr:TIGR00341 family protein [Microbacterium sp. ASV49]MDL9977704.1 TIGR00341 family protein [Microbacterium sp. ASV49]